MFKKILLIFISSIFILGMAKLSFAAMCTERMSHQQMAQANTGHQHEIESAAGNAIEKEGINVGNKICPVSNEKIDEKTKATYEYEGKIYNFCCPACISEFKKDPQKYIQKIEEEMQTKPEMKSDINDAVTSASKAAGGHQH